MVEIDPSKFPEADTAPALKVERFCLEMKATKKNYLSKISKKTGNAGLQTRMQF